METVLNDEKLIQIIALNTVTGSCYTNMLLVCHKWFKSVKSSEREIKFKINNIIPKIELQMFKLMNGYFGRNHII
jgi:hypothetical protein